MKVKKGEVRAVRAPMRARSVAILGVMLCVVLGGLFFWYSTYVAHNYGPATRAVLRVVPLPAAMVPDETVWMRDVVELAWLADVSGLEDPYDQALETAIRRAYVSSLANDLNVSVTQTTLDQHADQVDDALLDTLEWSASEYERYLLEPLLLAQMLEEALYDSPDFQSGAYDELVALQMQHEEVGIVFADLALQYSEGASAEVSGWLGYVSQDTLSAGYESVWDINVGETVIVEIDQAFVLLRVYDETFVEDQRSTIALQEIVVKKQTLSEVLDTYIGENSFIIRFVR